MGTCISHSPAETEALGEGWGRRARRSWVIGLTGELGSGKTQWVKGLARGLGIAERVRSPSFALVNLYSGGRLPLAHLDLYRLEGPDQILGVGLEEYLRPDGVTVIEWAERWFGSPFTKVAEAGPGCGRLGERGLWQPPPLFRWIHIETVSQVERRIIYEDPGA